MSLRGTDSVSNAMGLFHIVHLFGEGLSVTADRLAQLVEHRTAVREVAGSNLDRTNTQGLKITEEKVLPL